MSPENTRQVSALIDRIQTRFHEGHRKALPQLQAMAAMVEARGIDDGLVAALRTIGNALEQHMFKEEMRLFPMMEQGGNTLIGLLIEDLHHEHVEHESAMDDLRARLGRLTEAHSTDLALQQFIRGLDDLANELALHIRAEDEELFPLFATPASPDSSSTSNSWSPAITAS